RLAVSTRASRSNRSFTPCSTTSGSFRDLSQWVIPQRGRAICRLRYNQNMRSRKYRLITTIERLNNRLTRFALQKVLAPRAFALLATPGRRSGLPRYTPIGNGLVGDTFWLVAAHGNQADYVRNVRANPRVRLKVGRQWHSGTAVLLTD